MTKANKVNAYLAVIIGSDELAAQKITIKDLDKGEQKTVALADLLKEISKFEGNEDEFLRVISQYAGNGTGNHKRE